MLHQKLNQTPLEAVAKMAKNAIQSARESKTAPTGSYSWENADGTKTLVGAIAGTDETGTQRGFAEFVLDTTAPGTPTGIAASCTGGGTLVVSWAGTLDGGVPSDFDHITVLVDNVERGNLKRAGSLAIPGLSDGSHSVSAIAYDAARLEDGSLSPNASSASTPISVTVSNIAQDAIELAEQAEAVASATGQHFWPDTDGVHVTEVTQDEWSDSTSTSYHSGANVLLNALGQLFRYGPNNLLALLPAHYRTDEFTGDGTTTAFTLSVTPYEVTSVTVAGVTLTDEDWSASGDVVTLTTAPADGAVVTVAYRTSATSIAIFDGRGNQSSNAVAEFSEDGVTVGRTSSLNSFFNNLGIYFRNGVNNLLSLVAGKHYYHESNVTYGSTLYVSLGYYPVSIISVKLDGVEIEGYEVHGRYVTITEEYSGTKVCRVDYRASPTLNMFAGDGSSSLVAQLSANLVWLARGGFRINVNEGPSASEWRGSMSLVQDTQHQGGLALGVRANGSSYVTLEASGTGSAGSLVLDSDRSLTLHYLDKFSFVDGDVTTEQAYAVLSSPVTLFTGTYAQTHSAAVTLSETAANFSRMLIEWETADGNQGSTMLSNPNGKRFEAVALNCNTGTNPATYIKWKVFRVNGTTISNYSTDGTNANMQRGEVTLRNNGSVTTTRNEYIGIIRVLGWR